MTLEVNEPSAKYLAQAGYKRTDIGFIPDSWDVTHLGSMSSISSGGTPSRDRADYWDGDVPWITTSQVDFSRIQHADQFISKAGLQNSAAKILPQGTLLLALYGQGKTRGKVGILGIEAATNQACAAIEVTRDVSPDFLLHFLASRYDSIRGMSNGGSQDNLNSGIVKSILVPVPSPAEQRVIATALSDVDALIAGLERLIAKKRDIKQASMQQLLTGQTRLPGFSGEWKVKELGELCSLKSGQTITTESIDDHSPYRCFGGNGLRGFTATYTHDGSYVLIGRQGALCGNVIGVEGKFFASEHALVASVRADVATTWLTYVLGRMNLNQYSESSAQPGLSAAKLLVLDVVTPPTRGEQTAIATVLSDMDADLAALESRLAKTRAIKQGMMQELLTGRTRLLTTDAPQHPGDPA
jgi:type I restriction enzyme S subunit